MSATVLVDGENVRRSRWPNVSRDELVRRAGRWGDEHGRRVVVVFDGRAPEPAAGAEVIGSGLESADDRLVTEAERVDGPYWLVTSDRELRERAGGGAERTIGGGAFLGELGLAR